jgi:thiamine biosynthesis lipoprotein
MGSSSFAVGSPGAEGALDRFVYSQVHMGMQVRIVLYAPGEASARDAATAAFAEIARLEDVFSDYRPGSEVRRLTAAAGRHTVSEELFVVLERGLRLARQTGGAFDPAAGAVTEMWREAIRDSRLPSPGEIRQVAAAHGYEKLRLGPRSSFSALAPNGSDVRVAPAVTESATEFAVDVAVEGLRIDLGGIAKGFILDRARAVLYELGHDRVLIEAGGDIVVGGAPPGNRGWRVAVGRLGPGNGSGVIEYQRQEGVDPGPVPSVRDSRFPSGHACILYLADAAVSTSGDEAQFVEFGDRRYSHTVDPRTGLGLTHGRAATVVADDGLTADGLATALTILDEAEGGDLLRLYPRARQVAPLEDCRE